MFSFLLFAEHMAPQAIVFFPGTSITALSDQSSLDMTKPWYPVISTAFSVVAWNAGSNRAAAKHAAKIGGNIRPNILTWSVLKVKTLLNN